MAATRNRPSPDPVAALLQVLLGTLREVASRRADCCAGAENPSPGSLHGLRCVVGLSGGRDSVALLHALASLRAGHGLRLSALHVHHGLSPHADAWAAFCREICKLLDVPLAVEHVTVDRCSGLGLEGAAREARYAAFRGADADVLLLAHHAGDQAETLLFNLLRGAGLRGASGMPQVRPLGPPARPRDGRSPAWLLRPWLENSVAQIEAYRQHFGLQHIDDESNADTRFSRNFLRHQILPRLQERFPGAAERLAGAARRLREARVLNDELADLDLLTAAPAGRVELSALHRLSAARQRNLLRRWLAGQGSGARLGEEALDELSRQMRDAATDAGITMPAGPLVLRVWRGGLYALPAQPLAVAGEPPARIGELAAAVPAAGSSAERAPLRGCEHISDHARTRHPGAGRDPRVAPVHRKINEMNELDSGLRRNDEILNVQRMIFSQPLKRIIWRGESMIDWAGGRLHFLPAFGDGIAVATITAGQVEIRSRHGGERIRLAPGRPAQAVKSLLQAASVPPWERQRLPFLWCDDRLVAIPGIGVADAFAAKFSAGAGEAGVVLRWEPVPVTD